jgi:hypothetical protein
MPKFKNGVTVNGQGYLVISAGPHRGKPVHKIVAEAMLGRELLPSEDVHHKDENKLNPDWRNLDILPHGEHTAEGNRLRRLLKRKDKEARKHYEDHSEGSAGESNGDTTFP